jgi:phage shock protein A
MSRILDMLIPIFGTGILGVTGYSAVQVTDVPHIRDDVQQLRVTLEKITTDTTKLEVEQAAIKADVAQHTRQLGIAVNTQSAGAAVANQALTETRELNDKVDKIGSLAQTTDRAVTDLRAAQHDSSAKIDAIDRKTDALTDRLRGDEGSHFRAGPGH